MRKGLLLFSLLIASHASLATAGCPELMAALSEKLPAQTLETKEIEQAVEHELSQSCTPAACKSSVRDVLKNISTKTGVLARRVGLNRRVGVSLALVAGAGISSYLLIKGIMPESMQAYSKMIASGVALSFVTLVKPIKDPLNAKFNQLIYRLYGKEPPIKTVSQAEDFMTTVWRVDQSTSTDQMRLARGILGNSVGMISQGVTQANLLYQQGYQSQSVELLVWNLSFLAFQQPAYKVWAKDIATVVRVGFPQLGYLKSKAEFLNLLDHFESERYKELGLTYEGPSPSHESFQTLADLIYER